MQTQISLSSCRKVYVERDFSNGMNVAFVKELPPQLDGLIDRRVYEDTISTINSFFMGAGSVSFGTMLETLLGCGTCYLNRLFRTTRYDKQLIKIKQYIDEQNKLAFIPVGLYILDPMERGLRVLEISLLATGERRTCSVEATKVDV